MCLSRVAPGLCVWCQNNGPRGRGLAGLGRITRGSKASAPDSTPPIESRPSQPKEREMGDAPVKFTLGERDIPTHWVNLMADLPGDAPPPLTGTPPTQK